MRTWYQITLPHRGVCAGIIVDDEMSFDGTITERVVKTAPYFKYMVGWDLDAVKEFLAGKGTMVEIP